MKTTLQSEFNKYHDAIKLINTDDNKPLREKRDMLVKELRAYFDKKAAKEGTSKITFAVENQGSYSMGTGIKPQADGDYDIDIMILFNFTKDDYTPVEVKKWVYEALNTEFRTVEYKKPCVRVQYHKAGEEHFHVDMALYANGDTKTYLSVGKPNSATSDKKWEVSNPKLLKEKVNSRFTDSDESQQMKRIIRYLKRWKDLKFKNTENGKPTGIAITALALNFFKPEIDKIGFNSSVAPNDLTALKNLVGSIVDQFGWFGDSISVELPVEPYNDLFEKMTENQRKVFKERLESFKTALQDAKNEPDPHEASKMLRKQLGDDFPEVKKDTSGQKRSLAFPGKSESA